METEGESKESDADQCGMERVDGGCYREPNRAGPGRSRCTVLGKWCCSQPCPTLPLEYRAASRLPFIGEAVRGARVDQGPNPRYQEHMCRTQDGPRANQNTRPSPIPAGSAGASAPLWRGAGPGGGVLPAGRRRPLEERRGGLHAGQGRRGPRATRVATRPAPVVRAHCGARVETRPAPVVRAHCGARRIDHNAPHNGRVATRDASSLPCPRPGALPLHATGAGRGWSQRARRPPRLGPAAPRPGRRFSRRPFPVCHHGTHGGREGGVGGGGAGWVRKRMPRPASVASAFVARPDRAGPGSGGLSPQACPHTCRARGSGGGAEGRRGRRAGPDSGPGQRSRRLPPPSHLAGAAAAGSARPARARAPSLPRAPVRRSPICPARRRRRRAGAAPGAAGAACAADQQVSRPARAGPRVRAGP
jgi:hypothetical protein